ncbi:divalent anion:Na+ symporter, DASS-family transporter (putative sodium:sulfate symporter) [Syntrophobacter sp. SbD1]|nr:divalent anion:Na+ symporter, DASS-family transporter (putative sodium:sulfate symporter) [Syntrophobacter sp. SbD1]
MSEATGKTVALEQARQAPIDMKKAGIIAAVLVAGFVILAKPFAGLSPQGNGMIGVTLLGLSFWIFRPSTLPYLAGGSIILGGGLLLGLPLDIVAKGYTSPAVWVLIPALFFGFALIKTGLGKRIAYAVLKTFQPNYMGICVSWFVIGLLLSALTPSITVRLAIVIPIAFSLVEACKLGDRSKGSALISFVAFGTALLPGIGWQTGSLWGIFMMGFYPPEMRALATPGAWFQYMAFPWFFISILFVALVYIVFKPKEPLELNREAFKKQYAALGKITRDQVICASILIMALILFSTDKWTGIKTPVAALGAFAALMLFGIIKTGDIGTGVNWDIINFFGVVIGLSAMFAKAGVSDWAKPLIQPGILSMAHSPLVLLLVLTCILWAIRFIDIPWGFTTFALLSPVFIPLYQKFGLHPVLVSVAFIAAGNSMFMSYHQPFIIMSDTMTKSRAWSEKQVSIAGMLFAISIIVGIIVSTFYWKAMGLMP